MRRPGFSIQFDDESVRELPEGQDMDVQFREVGTVLASQKDGGYELDDEQKSGTLYAFDNAGVVPYELLLIF